MRFVKKHSYYIRKRCGFCQNPDFFAKEINRLTLLNVYDIIRVGKKDKNREAFATDGSGLTTGSKR